MLMQKLHQRVFRSTEPIEVVHVNGPGHGSEVPLFFNPVHLDLHTARVLVADPLGSLVGVGALALFVPFLGPA